MASKATRSKRVISPEAAAERRAAANGPEGRRAHQRSMMDADRRARQLIEKADLPCFFLVNSALVAWFAGKMRPAAARNENPFVGSRRNAGRWKGYLRACFVEAFRLDGEAASAAVAKIGDWMKGTRPAARSRILGEAWSRRDEVNLPGEIPVPAHRRPRVTPEDRAQQDAVRSSAEPEPARELSDEDIVEQALEGALALVDSGDIEFSNEPEPEQEAEVVDIASAPSAKPALGVLGVVDGKRFELVVDLDELKAELGRVKWRADAAELIASEYRATQRELEAQLAAACEAQAKRVKALPGAKVTPSA